MVVNQEEAAVLTTVVAVETVDVEIMIITLPHLGAAEAVEVGGVAAEIINQLLVVASVAVLIAEAAALQGARTRGIVTHLANRMHCLQGQHTSILMLFHMTMLPYRMQHHDLCHL